MKISILRLPQVTKYTTRFGRLTVPARRDKPPQLYPSATGGHVSIPVSRKDAAEGLRTWRATP